MGRISPVMAIRIGFAVLLLGILATVVAPFPSSDLVDGMRGLAVGIGLGMVIAAFLKRRGSCAR